MRGARTHTWLWLAQRTSAMVLAAAVMHAVWNTVMKVGSDRLITMSVVIGVSGLLAPALIAYGPPPALESWPYIILSALIHCAYFFFLIKAYTFIFTPLSPYSSFPSLFICRPTFCPRGVFFYFF